jgi:hypothetical protein
MLTHGVVLGLSNQRCEMRFDSVGCFVGLAEGRRKEEGNGERFYM